MKLRTSLNNWGKVIVDATTDEEIGDINLAIKYNDHGDDFLYVRTYSGEEYEYGYWFNRRYYPDYDADKNHGESDDIFIKRPILFRHPDETSEFSNEVFSILHSDYCGIQKHMDFGPQKYDDAERRIEAVLYRISSLTEDKYNHTMYDFTSYKKEIETFITINELGKEYLDWLNCIEWTSRINGFDGIAGKMASSNIIVCDMICSVLYRGKNMNIKKLRYSRERDDEWGFVRRIYNTKQLA